MATRRGDSRGRYKGSRGRYKIGTIARLLGLSPAVLRNWERRHGFLEPQRGPGGQRLYSEDDVRVLSAVRRMLDRGHSIGEIALQGRAALLRAGSGDQGSTAGGRGGAPAHSMSVPAPARTGAPAPLARGYGEVLESALALDSARLHRTLDTAFSLFDPQEVVTHVIEPATRTIGEMWVAGECGVASEHLASLAFKGRIQRLVESAAAVAPERPLAVTACFPDEQHELGALLIAFRLTRHGVRVVHLGPSLPVEDLEHAVSKLEPKWVLLSVTRPPTHDAHMPRLRELFERWRDRVQFVVGGNGVLAADDSLARRGVVVVPGSCPIDAVIDTVVRDEGLPAIPGADPRRATGTAR